MKPSQIRALSLDELRNKIDETHKALFNLRFKAAVGQVTDFNQVKATRRELARLNTILRERELASRATEGGKQ